MCRIISPPGSPARLARPLTAQVARATSPRSALGSSPGPDDDGAEPHAPTTQRASPTIDVGAPLEQVRPREAQGRLSVSPPLPSGCRSTRGGRRVCRASRPSAARSRPGMTTPGWELALRARWSRRPDPSTRPRGSSARRCRAWWAGFVRVRGLRPSPRRRRASGDGSGGAVRHVHHASPLDPRNPAPPLAEVLEFMVVATGDEQPTNTSSNQRRSTTGGCVG